MMLVTLPSQCAGSEVNIYTPYEGYCEDVLADGGKAVELEGSKKCKALLYCPNSREIY